MKLLQAISGGKTYGLAAALLVYIVVQVVNQQPVDDAVVYALLGGGLVTLRSGSKADARRAAGASTPGARPQTAGGAAS